MWSGSYNDTFRQGSFRKCRAQNSNITRDIKAAIADMCSKQTLLHIHTSGIYPYDTKQMPLRAEAWDRSQTCHERLVVEKVALRQVCYRVLRFFCTLYQATDAPYSFIHHRLWNCSYVVVIGQHKVTWKSTSRPRQVVNTPALGSGSRGLKSPSTHGYSQDFFLSYTSPMPA